MLATHRNVKRVLPALFAGTVLLAAPFVSARPAKAQSCLSSTYFGHAISGFLTNCVDTYQVSGLAYALGSSATSGSRNIICEAVNDPFPMGTAECNPESGLFGDGQIAINGNWGAPGVEGMCPNPRWLPGVGRNVFVVIDNRGQGIIASVGFDVSFGAYLAEYAHPAVPGPPGDFLPLECGAPGSGAVRLDGTTEDGGQVTANVTVSPSRIFSDCDADSLGVAFFGSGSCTEGAFPAVGRGNLYSRNGPCAGAIDLRGSTWSFAAAPAADGTASVVVTRPSDASCALIGATFTIGGAESPAIGSYVQILGAACRDSDGDGVADCQGDCDDGRSSVFPGRPEVCDAVDNNCNGSVDEDLTAVPETCDGVDNDCDGTIDNHGACGVPCEPVQKAGPDVRVTDDPAWSGQSVLAWTGSGYGVAWTDSRDEPESGREIYFARLSGSGEKIGPDVRVTHKTADSVDPSIVWTGSEYAIAWADLREQSGPFMQWDVFLARLDGSGNKIGDDLRVTTYLGDDVSPSLVWTGSEYGLAWSGRERHILFARLDRSGTRIGDEVQVTVSPSNGLRPRLVWTGSEYGLAWQNYRDPFIEILFVRLDSSGNRIGTPTLVTSAFADLQFPGPDLVWTGSQYGIVWQDYRFVNHEIFFARLSALGTKIGTDIRLTNDPAISRQPSVAWMGAGYVVVWQDAPPGNNEIFLARLDNAGARIAPDLRVTDGPGYSAEPALAWNGSDAAIVWRDSRGGNSDIYFARVTCNSMDLDGDGFSSCAECDDTRLDAHPGAIELCNRLDDDCNGLVDDDAAGADSDVDAVANACDNCASIPNPDQEDIDADFEGDVCDFDDGLILIMLPDKFSIEWQREAGFESFNEYRGDLRALRLTGIYTQDPGSSPLVIRNCDLLTTSVADGPDPGPGEAVFYLITGNHGGVEGSLGTNSSGAERPNTHPCPR